MPRPDSYASNVIAICLGCNRLCCGKAKQIYLRLPQSRDTRSMLSRLSSEVSRLPRLSV
jgi:hypothetical protein